jgi:hypothetical protein
MSKPNKALAAIDLALAETVERDRRRPGEFTAREFQTRAREGGSEMTYASCRARLAALVDRGKLHARPIVQSGKTVIVYSSPV